MFWKDTNGRIPILSWCRDVDAGALAQARNLCELPAAVFHVALMPDCHIGYGMPIGGILACRGALVPNAVGVDIGCGVQSCQTDASAERLTQAAIRRVLDRVRREIPVGFEHRRHPLPWAGWDTIPRHCPPVEWEWKSARHQLGTLGGGNHFLEIQADDHGGVWLMLHSGSRNFGLKIARHYHGVAQRICRKQAVCLPTPDLACLPADSEPGVEYLAAMQFALRFALCNREVMMQRFSDVLRDELDCRILQTIDVHHNYAAKEQHFGQTVYLHRKGATAARDGQPGVIPGSMGAFSYIVRGRGNAASFMSCSHGAGRRMGRREASRKLSEADCRRAMEGIVHSPWSRTRQGTPDLSEAPQAYKDIDEVIAAQADLVEPVVRLRPLAVLKG